MGSVDDTVIAPNGQTPQAEISTLHLRVREELVNELYLRMVRDKEPFWQNVYPLYMNRDITNNDVRAIVRKGLEETGGIYKAVVNLFNIPPKEYKRFLNFLRKHNLNLPFAEYRP